MSPLKLNQVTDAETADPTWKSLYRVGGTAALIVAMLIPIQIIVFIIYPPPGTVIDWFMLFQDNRLLGDSGLLRIEHGLQHAFPQRPIRGCHNR